MPIIRENSKWRKEYRWKGVWSYWKAFWTGMPDDEGDEERRSDEYISMVAAIAIVLTIAILMHFFLEMGMDRKTIRLVKERVSIVESNLEKLRSEIKKETQAIQNQYNAQLSKNFDKLKGQFENHYHEGLKRKVIID